MSSPVRRAFQVLTFASLVLLSAGLSAAVAQARPVLVELFTSEGCSDCPPADDLLARLDQQQFVPGAHAIVLSEHVTYWNHLGWRDPYSSTQMDERQEQYSKHFSLGSIYTPQMVVDGEQQFTGSDAVKLQKALESEAGKPAVEIEIADARIRDKNSVSLSIHLPVDARGMLFAAVAQDATVSQVSRGENTGRTLHHVAVVRAMKQFSLSSAAGSSLSLSVPAAVIDSSTPLRLVIFLADERTGSVTGAAEKSLRP